MQGGVGLALMGGEKTESGGSMVMTVEWGMSDGSGWQEPKVGWPQERGVGWTRGVIRGKTLAKDLCDGRLVNLFIYLFFKTIAVGGRGNERERVSVECEGIMN